MIKFINNIGEYFASNYFDEDFAKKVTEKSGYSRDALKTFQQQINSLKSDYFTLKQQFVENHLREKDKINLSNRFHTKVLKALGYDSDLTDYNNLFFVSDDAALPVRHTLYRGDKPHMMIMEMRAMIKTGEEEPDGLFEQRYNVDNDQEERSSREQKYHRSQWSDIFTVPAGVRISPMIINEAVSKLFLMPGQRRPNIYCSAPAITIFCLKVKNGSGAPTCSSTLRYSLTSRYSTATTWHSSIFCLAKICLHPPPMWC